MEMQPLSRILRPSEMLIGKGRSDSSLWGTINKIIFHEIRFIHILNRAGILADGCCKRIQADRSSVKFIDNGKNDIAVVLIQSHLIDLKQIQCKCRNFICDSAIVLDFRKIPDTF